MIYPYVVFLGSTFVGGALIFLWFFCCWLIFSALNHLGGWPLLFLVSWLTAVIIFFQGTRIREWLDAI